MLEIDVNAVTLDFQLCLKHLYSLLTINISMCYVPNLQFITLSLLLPDWLTLVIYLFIFIVWQAVSGSRLWNETDVYINLEVPDQVVINVLKNV